MPEHEVPIVILSHRGFDGLRLDWVGIVFDDRTWIQCFNKDAVLIDNSESLEISCQNDVDNSTMKVILQA